MNTRSFNVLHNSGDKHIFAVAYRVNFNFFADNVFVNQHRSVLINFNGGFKISPERFFICNNLHCTSAQNVTRPHKHGISDFLRRQNSVLDVCYRMAFGLRDFKLCHNLFKRISVFGSFNCQNVRSDNLNTSLFKRFGKIYCSLSAERRNNARRLFKLNNIHNVFNRKRFKIKLVARCVVG